MSEEDKPKVRARSQAKAKGGKKKGAKKKSASKTSAPKKRKGGSAAGILLGLFVVGTASWFVFGNPEIIPKKKPPAKQNVAKAMKTGKPDPARPTCDDCALWYKVRHAALFSATLRSAFT